MEPKWIKGARGILGDGHTVLAPIYIEVGAGVFGAVEQRLPDGVSEDSILDLGNVTITPGLFNLHDHICRKFIRDSVSELTFSQRAKLFMAEDDNYLLLHSVRNARDALSEGVTYLRDYGLAGRTSVHLGRAIEEGLIDGPEVSACGNPVCMSGGHTYRQSHEADGVDGVRTAVREELRGGAKLIKFMASGGLEHFPVEDPTLCQYTVEELKAGVEAAHAAGILTAAHAYPAQATKNCVHAGVDSIEHGVFLDDEAVKLMSQNGTCLVPTFSGLRGLAAKLPATEAGSLMKRELQRRIFEPHVASARRASEAGILIGTGTDTAGIIADEIRIVAEALELNPVQAIEHATSIGAKIVGRSDLGLVAKGKRADFVAFAGDLTASLDVLDRAEFVWKKGVQVSGQSL